MQYKKFLLGLTLTSLSILAPLRSTSAQEVWRGRRGNCTLEARVTPAMQTKEIINREFGFSFKIPANYTAEVSRTQDLRDREKLRISLLNPADTAFSNCSRKNGVIGWGTAIRKVSIIIKKIPNGVSNIKDLPIFNHQVVTLANRNETMIANQPAVIHTLKIPYKEYQEVTASIFSPDRQYLVDITLGSYEGDNINREEKVFSTVIKSFTFRK